MIDRAGASSPASSTPDGAPAPRRGGSMIEDLMHLLQGRVSMVVVKFAITVAASWIWKEDAIGIIALALVVPSMVVDGVDLGTKKSLPFLISRSGRTIQEVTSTAMMMWLLVSLVAVPVSIAILLSPAMKTVPALWGVLGAMTIPFSLFTGYSKSYAIGVRQLGHFKHITWARDPITLVIILVCGLLLGLSAPEQGWIRLAAEVAGVMVAGVIGVRFISRHARPVPRWDGRLMKEMIGHSFKFGLGMWSMKLNYRVSLMLLGLATFAVPPGDIGNYSRALVVAMMLWWLPGMLGTVIFARNVSGGDSITLARQTAMIARVTTIAGVPFAFALWVVAPWVMPWLFGPGFAFSGEIVRVFIPGILAFFMSRVFDADLSARGRPLSVLTVMAPVAVLNVVLGLVLIPAQGAIGAAWATSICFVTGTIALGVLFAFITKMSVVEVFLPRAEDFRLVATRLLRFAERAAGRRRRRKGGGEGA